MSDQPVDGGFSSEGEETGERLDSVGRGGWYADPFDAADERWWDGTKWTQNVRGAPRQHAAAAGATSDAAGTDRVRAMGPGWYPYRGEVVRWWDGEKWGPARHPSAASVGSRTPEQDVGWRVRAGVAFEQAWLIPLGYVCAVFLPILGLLFGIVVVTRPGLRSRRRQGVQIIVLSVLVTAIAVLLARHK